MNEDATWCTNEDCSVKTECWRWMGFYEGEQIDMRLVRRYIGGENCPHKIDGIEPQTAGVPA